MSYLLRMSKLNIDNKESVRYNGEDVNLLIPNAGKSMMSNAAETSPLPTNFLIEKAMDQLEDIRARCKLLGVNILLNASGNHWRFMYGKKCVLQFWPTTHKHISALSPRGSHCRDLEDVMTKLKFLLP
jgi:hypothetical protein